jgi:hypothetical protein
VKPPTAVLGELAAKVTYVGSPEHKTGPSFAGRLAPRATASICPPELANQREVVESWLKDAILAGTFSEEFTGSFPRYVWHKLNGRFYEARLTNKANGAYKGYPIEEEQIPL